MLSASQVKEHVLNRVGYGPSVWHSTRYDQLGASAYIAEQLAGSLPGFSDLTTYASGKVTRGVLAQRSLEAVLVEFWYNHFNIDTYSEDPLYRVETMIGRTIDEYHNVAIWPNILGDFNTLLVAVAKSPAMLDYLNNRINYEDEVVDGVVYGGNDNYSRELMELHTLGVDGGYNEIDITEAARILTGWSVTDDVYEFKSARHDYNTKTILGVTYPAGVGEQEGLDFLMRLASHPSTARFLATKMVRRLVNEDAPNAIVDAAATAFGGARDLGAMTAAIFAHPDFSRVENFRAKVKPPHRFVASAIASMGATAGTDWVGVGPELYTLIETAGEDPFAFAAPTGHPEVSDYWVSPTSMITRFEMAERMAYHQPLVNKLKLRIGVDGSDIESTVDAVAATMLPGGVADLTRDAVLDHVAANATRNDERISAAAHLIMCSPEFVRF